MPHASLDLQHHPWISARQYHDRGVRFATASTASLSLFSLSDKKTTPFDAVESRASTGAVVSPDGRWVAYALRAVDSDPTTVFVQPFPPTGAKYQISKGTEDGHHQVWSLDSTQLFYTPGPGSQMLRVTVTSKPTLSIGEATAVARPFANAPPTAERTYDLSHDGKRFLGLSSLLDAGPGAASSAQILVVLNWCEELKQRALVR